MKIDERNRMIAELVDDMDSWDHDTLLEWAKDRMHDILDGMTDNQIREDYDRRMGDKS